MIEPFEANHAPSCPLFMYSSGAIDDYSVNEAQSEVETDDKTVNGEYSRMGQLVDQTDKVSYRSIYFLRIASGLMLEVCTVTFLFLLDNAQVDETDAVDDRPTQSISSEGLKRWRLWSPTSSKEEAKTQGNQFVSTKTKKSQYSSSTLLNLLPPQPSIVLSTKHHSKN